MDGVVGIAEIMDYVGVYSGSERMYDITEKGLESALFSRATPLCSWGRS